MTEDRASRPKINPRPAAIQPRNETEREGLTFLSGSVEGSNQIAQGSLFLQTWEWLLCPSPLHSQGNLCFYKRHRLSKSTLLPPSAWLLNFPSEDHEGWQKGKEIKRRQRNLGSGGALTPDGRKRIVQPLQHIYLYTQEHDVNFNFSADLGPCVSQSWNSLFTGLALFGLPVGLSLGWPNTCDGAPASGAP